MQRDRFIRIVLGLVIGTAVALGVWVSMRGKDTEWSFGPHQPVFAGILVGLAVAALIAATTPTNRS